MSLPPPLTASAREARFAFYCTLCSKGYSRIHEFEAHENSYDHQHKKRFQEMKAMQKPVFKSERSDDGGGGVMRAIKIEPLGGKKKGGFKSAFGAVEGKKDEGKVLAGGKDPAVTGKKEEAAEQREEESETEDEADAYDPERPTGP
ncbi:zinc finger domain-containing protein [Pyronema domesticum]|uniref:Similar to G patch domain-containing protein 8 acc. no. A2A6A1 n=1 Tax=Pyronema omphalodes (strain CBS 100304) TaxID=1076935 RepID=U4LM44_PYROM|nr:zinc finger domain-containing protein [Pyronema domesticum]CCX33209.1 Similar to G patch domain-containing protein 8; acc. no. A2A6A1 [Pyronema omphalodes CBS 100304]